MTLSITNPIGQFTQLPVNDIDLSSQNPRRSINPEYSRLKVSLKQNGFDSPLVVTKDPKSNRYTLYAGGNTRLAIAQSLYNSGDQLFQKVPCVIRDISNSLDSLVAHLRENDIRGNLSFIDRAIAIKEFGDRVQETKLKNQLSQRDLAKELRKHGYTLSQTVISAMIYAVNRLYSSLPKALDQGMGKRQVNEIRTLDHSARRVWRNCKLDQQANFDEVFVALCSRHDDDTLDVEALIADVAHEIAVAADLDQNAVLLMLEAERAGEEVSISEFQPIKVDGSRKSDSEPRKRHPFKRQRHLQRQRLKLTEAAVELAQQFEFSDSIQVTPNERFGYLMSELPPRRCSKKVLTMWKLLAAACDQSRMSKRHLKKVISVDSRLASEMSNAQKVTDVYHSDTMPLIDVFDLGTSLIQWLDDSQWERVMQLLSAYREIRRLAVESNNPETI